MPHSDASPVHSPASSPVQTERATASTSPNPGAPGPHVPSYRAPSQANHPVFRSARQRGVSAGAFVEGADRYHDVRPSYPAEVLELVGSPTGLVLDLGAGTGKLTASLASRGLKLLACDPSAEMLHQAHLACPDIPLWQATAEATALREDSVEVVTCAQTWHWVEHRAASRELDRVIQPGGHLVLAWNTIDVADPWVLRLARIMHSGDILKEGFTPPLAAPWQVTYAITKRWSTPMSFADILALTATRSYWLRSSHAVRAKVQANLEWYFFEHSGFPADVTIELPYRTDAFVARRSTEL